MLMAVVFSYLKSWFSGTVYYFFTLGFQNLRLALQLIIPMWL